MENEQEEIVENNGIVDEETKIEDDIEDENDEIDDLENQKDL